MRWSITQFVISYLTFRCLHEDKGCLIRIFANNKRKFAKTNYDKIIEDMVLDKDFFEYHNLFKRCVVSN